MYASGGIGTGLFWPTADRSPAAASAGIDSNSRGSSVSQVRATRAGNESVPELEPLLSDNPEAIGERGFAIVPSCLSPAGCA